MIVSLTIFFFGEIIQQMAHMGALKIQGKEIDEAYSGQ